MRALDILRKKNSDYSKVESGFSNFLKVAQIAGVPTEQVFLMHIGTKIARIENLLRVDHGFTTTPQVADEAIEDTLLDLMNYANLLAVFIKENRRF